MDRRVSRPTRRLELRNPFNSAILNAVKELQAIQRRTEIFRLPRECGKAEQAGSGFSLSPVIWRAHAVGVRHVVHHLLLALVFFLISAFSLIRPFTLLPALLFFAAAIAIKSGCRYGVGSCC
jgi:hypothetical protein